MVLSLFIHVIVFPAFILMGFGENALLLRVVAPFTIDTVASLFVEAIEDELLEEEEAVGCCIFIILLISCLLLSASPPPLVSEVVVVVVVAIAVIFPYGSAFCKVFVRFICQSFIFMVLVIATSFPSIAFAGAFVTLKYPIAPLSSGIP